MHSTNALGGLLRRNGGRWYWVRSGTPAPQILDGTFADLAPRFRETHLRGKPVLLIPFGWRKAQPGIDATVAAMVDWLANRGDPILIGNDEHRTPNRRQRIPGNAVEVRHWEALMLRPIATWDDSDARAVFDKAIAESLLPVDDDLDDDVKRTFSRFYFGRRWQHPERAAAQWFVVESHLRDVFSYDRAGYRKAESRAWRWCPDNLEDLTEAELIAHADAFGFP